MKTAAVLVIFAIVVASICHVDGAAPACKSRSEVSFDFEL
jgi:hypothetical protein